MAKKRKHRRTRKWRALQPGAQATRRRSTSVEPPLLVFVSSVIHGMEEERETVERAVRSIPLARAWRFETAPASSQEVEESYLSKVQECDIFIMLLGDADSSAVRREYETALEAGRPVLAFVADADRPPELDEFVASIRSKYARFKEPDDLYDAVRAAVFDEVIRRFRSAIRPKDAREFVETVAPAVQTYDVREILDCVILGIVDQPLMRTVFEVFGGKPLSGPPSDPTPPFEDIYFTHLDEAKDVFDAVSRVVSKARKSRGDRQKAFEQALTNEVIARASHFAVQRAGLRPTDSAARVPPGFRYVIFRVHSKYAPIIRLLQTREVVEGPTKVKRDAEEFVFDDPAVLGGMATVFDRAQRGSGGDPVELVRLIVEGAARLRILGPDALSEDH